MIAACRSRDLKALQPGLCRAAPTHLKFTTITHATHGRPAGRPAAQSLSSAAVTTARYDCLLRFASDSATSVQVAVRDLPGPGGGRGIVAEVDVPPGGVLLSVPLSKVFTSKPYTELDVHWAADMGLRLLQERHACRQVASSVAGGASSGSTSTSSGNGSSGSASSGPTGRWCPWIDCLPTRVVTPLEFTPDQVQGCGVPSTIQDINNMQEALRDCYERLRPGLEGIGCGWDDLLWAVQVLHSRCFFDAGMGLHLLVPGVDMANDAGKAANATVRVLHSPDACQGAAALEDVAPAGAAAAGGPQASFFQLVAGEDGISKGDEVAISYGHRWPAEPYFLLFGFVPQGNPDESVVLFSDLADLAEHYCRIMAGDGSSAAAEGSSGGSPGDGSAGRGRDEPAARGAAHEGPAPQQLEGQRERGPEWTEVAERAIELSELQPGGGPGAFGRLVVTAAGLDSRLGPALELVRQAADEVQRRGQPGREEACGRAGLGPHQDHGFEASPSLQEVAAHRLREIRDATLRWREGGADGEGGAAGAPLLAGGGGDEARRLLLEYRRAKLAVMDLALRGLTGQQ